MYAIVRRQTRIIA